MVLHDWPCAPGVGDQAGHGLESRKIGRVLVIFDRLWAREGRQERRRLDHWVEVCRSGDGALGLVLGPVAVWWEPKEEAVGPLQGHRGPVLAIIDDPVMDAGPRDEALVRDLQEWFDKAVAPDADASQVALSSWSGDAARLLRRAARELELLTDLGLSSGSGTKQLAAECKTHADGRPRGWVG